MATEFKLPELGENIESADIIKVMISEGDKVEKDQNVIEIETDKATVEVPSEISGTVKKVNVKEGDSAKVGDVIFTVEENETEEKKEEPEGKDKVGDEKEEDSEKEADEKTESEEVEQKEESEDKESDEEEEMKRSGGGTEEFKVPDLGENIESADVIKVLVSEGDDIQKDDPVIEIETDKATVEVPSEVSGKITKLNVKEGDKVKVGDVILVIESSGTGGNKEAGTKKKSEQKEGKKVEPKKEEKKELKKEEKSSGKEIKQETKYLPTVKSSDMPKKIAPAAPSVRRFAREIGIDIHQVSGTGPGGRISIEDVKVHSKNMNEKIAKGGGGFGIPQEALPDFAKFGKIEREKMSNIRRKTAEHLSYAWATIPHVTQFDKADITETEKLRKQFGKKVEEAGGKLTVTAILLKIIASALKAFPQFNASVDMNNKEIIYKKYINVGIAVDTDRGLIVPVVRDVDKKNIIELSLELSEIAEKARNKKVTLEEMQGGNFSISNLGGIGGTYFTPVVNSPEVAILGVSRGAYEPVYKDGEFVPRLMLPLSLSYDHRVIDGADAIKFLRWVATALEQPFLLSLEG